MSSRSNSPGPCYCGFLHKNCDPATCSQAGHASEGPLRASLKDFRRSGESGCPTCAILVDALSTPTIRDIWRKSIEPALQAQRYGVVNEMRNDEEEIGVELNPTNKGSERRVLRTRASDGSEDWRHFNVWHEGNSGKFLRLKFDMVSIILNSSQTTKTSAVELFHPLNTIPWSTRTQNIVWAT